MKILVTGSREWDNDVLLRDALDAVRRYGGLSVIVGDCPTGADEMTREWCGDFGVPFAVYKADWVKYGKAAGPYRNYAMVDDLIESAFTCLDTAYCLAFYKEGAGNRGTRHCSEYAESRGVAVQRFYG